MMAEWLKTDPHGAQSWVHKAGGHVYPSVIGGRLHVPCGGCARSVHFKPGKRKQRQPCHAGVAHGICDAMAAACSCGKLDESGQATTQLVRIQYPNRSVFRVICFLISKFGISATNPYINTPTKIQNILLPHPVLASREPFSWVSFHGSSFW